MKRNKYLTPGMHDILTRLATGIELDEFVPGGWWVENDRVSAKNCWQLLRLCVISEDGFAGKDCRHYLINSDGRRLLEDPEAIPLIISATA